MALTKLDAINECLAAIGSAPVSSEDDPSLDAAMASAKIDQVSLDIQSKGLWFNREGNWKLTPDSNGEILVPNNAIDIVSWGASRPCQLSIRGNRIYDSVDHTFNLSELVQGDGKIEFLFITQLPYNDMPPVAQTAVLYRARRLFAQDVDGDSQRWRENNYDEIAALHRLESDDRRNSKHNALRDNPATATVIAATGGRNGGIYGQYGLSSFPRSRNN